MPSSNQPDIDESKMTYGKKSCESIPAEESLPKPAVIEPKTSENVVYKLRKNNKTPRGNQRGWNVGSGLGLPKALILSCLVFPVYLKKGFMLLVQFILAGLENVSAACSSFLLYVFLLVFIKVPNDGQISGCESWKWLGKVVSLWLAIRVAKFDVVKNGTCGMIGVL
ncbi:hypothetical protein Tco_0089123 [Tanacetum coccineum]